MCPYPIRTCRSDLVRFRTKNCTNLYDRFWIVQKDRTLNTLIQKELRDFMYDRTFCTVKNRKVKGENKYVLCVRMIKNYARVGIKNDRTKRTKRTKSLIFKACVLYES